MKASAPDRICSRCILSSSFPGVQLGDDGVCNICRSAPAVEEMDAVRNSLRDAMRSVIDASPGRSRYDCVVAYSGGKDSTFALQLLVREYGARCLALTVDNGFLSEQALENGHRVTSALEVDFLLFKPSPTFMNRMYRTSATTPGIHARSAITRGSAICNSCINLINNIAVITALEKNIPTIAGGYLGGQVPKDAAVIRIDLASQLAARKTTLEKYESHFGPEARRYFDIDPELLQRSTMPHLNVINPMLTLSVSESQIIDTIRPLGWERPADTGAQSSNCRLNDVGIVMHHRQHGFNPYTAEIAEQVRYGLMSRDEGLRRAAEIPDPADVTQQAMQVGIDLNA
jgi:predicted PP-loop superfamily ATPase